VIQPVRPDPTLGAFTRVMMELAAWTLAPWALYESGSPLLALIAGIVLILLPALFSTPGDKKFTPIPVRGGVRLAIELGLGAAAVAGASALFGLTGGACGVVILLLYLGFGWRRIVWLTQTTPP